MIWKMRKFVILNVFFPKYSIQVLISVKKSNQSIFVLEIVDKTCKRIRKDFLSTVIHQKLFLLITGKSFHDRSKIDRVMSI